MNLHSRHVWHQYKTLGLCTNTKRESKSYFPSSSYSWYSSVKRVQVVVAISQPSAFAAISELSSSTTITLLFLRLAGFWGQNLNVDVDSREGEVCRRAGSTALPTSHRMRRLTAVHLFSAVRETRAVTAGGRSGASVWGATPATSFRFTPFLVGVWRGDIIVNPLTHLEMNVVKFNWPNVL